MNVNKSNNTNKTAQYESETHITLERQVTYNKTEYEPELVTCGHCGNQWDGFAQCNCYVYDSTENKEEHIEESQEPIPTSHPMGWSPMAHYGMCGQSCPCCRAEVGDTLGACPICKKN